MNRKQAQMVFGGILTVAVLGFVVFPWAYRQAAPATGQVITGYVEGTETNISSKIPGRIQELLVREGDEVVPGQIVARLESRELTEQLNQAKAALTGAAAKVPQAEVAQTLTGETVAGQIAQAQANLQAAEAKLAALENGARPQEIEQARAVVMQAQVGAENAALTYQRMEALFQAGAVAAKTRDDAKADADVKAAGLQQAAEKLSLVEAGVRPEEIDGARALVAQAKAALQLAEAARHQVALKDQDITLAQAGLQQAQAVAEGAQAMVDNTVIRAPQKGIITGKFVQPGELVSAGLPIYTVVDVERVWVKAQVPEGLITRLAVGQEIGVQIDGLTGQLTGKLVWINASADFAVKKATQDSGDYDRKTFTVKVELDNREGLLKNGMTARIILP
ncbi:MAG: efflux RND transporter periplasmic adaptor subunit [Heliobacteriaceae bacterium]|nr:efflux RND transporter periplasmic adaptor subunit [Heliobacteriaceae bacterium]